MRHVAIPLNLAVILLCMGLFTARWYQSYKFDVGCGNYLKRAADAPTIDMATTALNIAIAYAEENYLINGNSGIIFIKPENDIGYWYGQLVSARNLLIAAEKENSSMSESNVLIKLRETIQDQTKEGTKLTLPIRISIYPNHIAWTIGTIIATIVCLICFFSILYVLRTD